MKKRPLSEGERVLLSAALMNQARLERGQGLPAVLHDRIEQDQGAEALADLNSYLNKSQDRADLFELFAQLVVRGHLVIESPIIILDQA